MQRILLAQTGPGMILAKEILNPEGMVLCGAGTALSEALIERLANMDVVDVNALNQDSREKQAGAECMKAIMQYRLTKSVPWFQIVQGGLQDAQTTGVVCGHAYWDYKADPRGANIETETPQEEMTEQPQAEKAEGLEVQQPGPAPTARSRIATTS